MDVETESFVRDDRNESKGGLALRRSVPNALCWIGRCRFASNSHTTSLSSRLRTPATLVILVGIICGFYFIYHNTSPLPNKFPNGFFKQSYSSIQSIKNLDIVSKDIRLPTNLCESHSSCVCLDPFVPVSRPTDQWNHYHTENNEILIRSNMDGIKVIFYGDSITYGWTKPENINVFHSLFNTSEYKALAMGIPGDRTEHLLYRLQNGELPSQSIHEPKIFWVLIGTNDLGSNCRPEVVLVGILRIIEELLLKQPKGIIVIQGILPRSISAQNGYLLYNGSYWRAIQAINEELKAYSNHRSRRVHYFDSTDIFLLQQNSTTMDDELQLQIDQELMYDFLHPSTIGYQKWGEEILKKLNNVIH